MAKLLGFPPLARIKRYPARVLPPPPTPGVLPAPGVFHYYNQYGWASPTNPKYVPGVSANVGDLLVAFSATEHSQFSYVALPTGGSPVWTEQIDTGGVSSGQAAIWTAPVTAPLVNQTISLTKTNDSGFYLWSFDILRIANGTPGAVVGAANAVDNEPNISITTTQNNSSVLVIFTDLGAVSGAGRVWKTVNGFTPTIGNGGERTYARQVGNYSVYAAFYPDVGAAGAKLVGIDTLAVGGFTVLAIEVKRPLVFDSKWASNQLMFF